MIGTWLSAKIATAAFLGLLFGGIAVLDHYGLRNGVTMTVLTGTVILGSYLTNLAILRKNR
jgi:hypothetical protein